MDSELSDIFSRLRMKAEIKRDRAKAAADVEFLADIQNIDRLVSLDQIDGELPSPKVAHTPLAVAANHLLGSAKKVGGRKNGPTAAVRKAISTLGDGFSVASLATHFDADATLGIGRPAIYSAINKMMMSNEIERMLSSDGARSSEYRIVKLKNIE